MSNPRVTITLGRTGQVVERGGSEADFSRGYDVSGSKRSYGDRQGFNSNLLSANKRQRGDSRKWSSTGSIQQDYQLSRSDLRLKLIRKRLPKQSLRRRDLPMKLSKTVQIAPSHGMPQYRSEADGSTLFRKIPQRESADDLLLLDSLRNPYSSRVTNGLRGQSPDRTLRMLGLSPPRNFDEPWKVQSSARAAHASRDGRFPISGVLSSSRPIGSMPVTVKAPPGTEKLVPHFAPGSASMQHSSHMVVDEPRSVAGLLHTLGLGKYAILFQAEEVDMTALRQMGDKDLKDLGLPMGPRKKIILALLASRPKRQPHH